MNSISKFAVAVLALTATATVPGWAAGANKKVVAEGIVAGAPEASAKSEFNLRSSGQVWRVHVHSGVSLKGVHGGDRVRVFGRPVGRVLTEANVRVLASRDSDNPSDYTPANKTVGR